MARLPEESARYCLAVERLTGGNAVTLLQDGREAYPAMLKAIAEARHTIHLEAYILRSDRTGRRFADALEEAAHRGVEVRLLYDAVGSMGIAGGFLDALKAAGVRLLAYEPLRLASLLGGFHRRDHRKILVADARIGFAGSLNIADECAPREEGGGGWRDLQVRVEGPAAARLDAEFLGLWNRMASERLPFPPAAEAGAQAVGNAWVAVLANRNLVYRHRIRRAYVKALTEARQSVVISSAYFIPDRGILRALCRAAARGVSVRVLVPASGDVPLAACAGRHVFGRLLARGVRIFLFQDADGMMHSKAASVDGIWGTVGSYNLDHRSLFHNLEMTVIAVDRGLGEALGRAFEADLAHAREVDPEAWRRRSWKDRLCERLAYLLKFWL